MANVVNHDKFPEQNIFSTYSQSIAICSSSYKDCNSVNGNDVTLRHNIFLATDEH